MASGAGRWDKEAKMHLWNVEGRPSPTIMQRVSLELRFRARCQPESQGNRIAYVAGIVNALECAVSRPWCPHIEMWCSRYHVVFLCR